MYGGLFKEVQRAQARHPAPAAIYRSRLTFDPAVPPQDRRWIVQAIAHSRAGAIRLISKVDAGTYVTVLHGIPGSWVGYAQRTGAGRYQVSLNLDELDGTDRPGRDWAVLHELGHVVDGILVPDDLRDRLVAELPRTGQCPRGYGDCSPPSEKFADTFAKWAFGGPAPYRDGGGYEVGLPPALDAWGAPLERLG